MTLHADVELPLSLEVDADRQADAGVRRSDQGVHQRHRHQLGAARRVARSAGAGVPDAARHRRRPAHRRAQRLLAAGARGPADQAHRHHLDRRRQRRHRSRSCRSSPTSRRRPARVAPARRHHGDARRDAAAADARVRGRRARRRSVPAAVLELGGRGAGDARVPVVRRRRRLVGRSRRRRASPSPIRSCGCRGATPSTCARASLGEPDTADATPARVEVIVDTVAPTGGFDVAGSEIRMTASDAVSPPEALQFRFAVAGGAFGPWIAADHAVLPAELDAGTLHVQARDEAGNVGDLGFHGRSTLPSTSGCNCALAGRADGSNGSSGTTGGMLLIAVAGGVLLFARRRRVWLRRIAIAGGAAMLAAVGPAPAAARTASARATSTTPRTRSAATTTSSSRTARSSSAPTTTPWAISSSPRSTIPSPTRAGRSSTASTRPAPPTCKGGYRFGVSDPGPDVGQYTSIALSGGNADDRLLRRLQRRAQVRARAAPVRRQHRRRRRQRQHRRRALRRALGRRQRRADHRLRRQRHGRRRPLHLRAARRRRQQRSPVGASDWTHHAPSTPRSISCAGRCGGGSACIVPAMVNGMPNVDPSKSTCVAVDAAPCAATCTATQACIDRRLHRRAAAAGRARSHRGHRPVRAGAPQLAGAARPRLLRSRAGRPQDGDRRAGRVDGLVHRRQRSRPPTSASSPRARSAADDSVHVAYVDAIHDRLLYKHVVGGAAPATPTSSTTARAPTARTRSAPAPTSSSTAAARRASSTRIRASPTSRWPRAPAPGRTRIADRHRRLRLLPAPGLRRRQALLDRVRLRSAERPGPRSAPSRSTSARPDPVEQQRQQVLLPRVGLAGAPLDRERARASARAAVRKQMIEVSGQHGHRRIERLELAGGDARSTMARACSGSA